MTVYRTAQGSNIDMSAFATQHEKTRAVGNMNVNARGDILDSNNQVIKDSTKRVRTAYARTINDNNSRTPQRPQTAQRTQPQNIPVVQPYVEEPDALTADELEFEDYDEEFKDVKKETKK